MDIYIVTIIESLFLVYMYFFFKTSLSFDSAIFEKKIQSLGDFFVHDTHTKENKVCAFGKIMAIVAIILAFVRAYFFKKEYATQIIFGTIVFDTVCLSLAYVMNMNAFVYVLPLMVFELYVVRGLPLRGLPL